MSIPKSKLVPLLLIGAAVAAAVVVPRLLPATQRSPSTGSADVLPVVAAPAWEADNPILPLPAPPLGVDQSLADLPDPPTPERVRLGRWLFFDKRLSGDGTISCASCHQSPSGFSQRSAVSTGINGKLGKRKAPPILNLAWTIYPHFFWDGRADSLEAQALGPMADASEMGNTHERMIATLAGVKGYGVYFRQAFGDDAVTVSRVAKAIADYERTRFSGNSPWDRWRDGDKTALGAQAVAGQELFFFGKAACGQCHLGTSFTDGSFHNLGVGWDESARAFADAGRYAVTGQRADLGAFKTPTLREAARRAPYMHDGSLKSLRQVVEFYNRGGNPNPTLSLRVKPLNLSEAEIDQLVAFLESLSGEGFADEGPKAFPQ